MSWAQCDRCGSEAYFDALVDYNGKVVNIFETAWCPGCEDEIKYAYTIIPGESPNREGAEDGS